ncbi:MAG: hypothetical protein HQL52_02360 [Magnetococcales bacterium]|nr:hypothetical protein [Magnetococcales bacterium]
MPDLFVHFASGYLVAPKLGLQGRREAVFVVGALLPDFLARIPIVVLDEFFQLNTLWFFLSFHTPAALLVSCYFLAMLFPQAQRRDYFGWLFSGALLHQCLDLMQGQFHEGTYMLFFPFSFKTTELRLFHNDAGIYLFPLLMMAVVWSHRQRKRLSHFNQERWENDIDR